MEVNNEDLDAMVTTIKLLNRFNDSSDKASAPVSDSSDSKLCTLYKGKYVIVRNRNEGINFGLAEEYDANGIYLKGAIRLWYHKPNSNDCWYESVAKNGLDPSSQVSIPVDKIMFEDYSMTLCSEVAIKSILAHKSYKK